MSSYCCSRMVSKMAVPAWCLHSAAVLGSCELMLQQQQQSQQACYNLSTVGTEHSDKCQLELRRQKGRRDVPSVKKRLQVEIRFVAAGIQSLSSAKERVQLEAYAPLCACRFSDLLAWQWLPPKAAEPHLAGDPAGANASTSTPYSDHRSTLPRASAS